MTTLLEASGLSKTFRSARGKHGVVAVDDVSFELAAGSTLAVVGESGAGKSTLGRLLLRLIEPDKGTARLDGVELGALNAVELRRMRPHMQMIFQDPYNSLDPRYSIGRAVAEPLKVHSGLNRIDQEAAAARGLETVGLGRDYLERTPQQLSGGELQRVAIARALVFQPKLIVCDEPVAALDVSIRAQLLNLLLDIQAETNVSYIYITHDLSTVRLVAPEILVMRRGQVVERGRTKEVLAHPRVAYTRALVDAVPTLKGALSNDEDTAAANDEIDPTKSETSVPGSE